jgi:hypothetical protein
MHPIERLRYVARASGADHGVLVRETASILAGFGFDPAGLVTACRRIVDRHTAVGPLWWLCSHMLTASDPMAAAWQCADRMEDDPTADQLALMLPDDATVCVLGWPEAAGQALVRRGDVEVLVVDSLGEGSGLVRRLQRADVTAIEVPPSGLGAAAATCDLVIVEASAVGPDAFVAVAGSRAAAAVAYTAEIPVWLVAGVGRLLPASVWNALADRLTNDSAVEAWDADDELVPMGLVTAIANPFGVEELDVALKRVDCPVAPELFRRTAF